MERLLWWPNGTVRLDVYPDGLHTAVGDDAYLVITPGEDDNPVEYVWDTADARYLGGGADFVWDTTFTPEFGTVYRVELRIGVPGVPENVRMSGRRLFGRGGWSGGGEVPRVDQTRHPGSGNGLVLQHSHVRDRSPLGHERYGPLRRRQFRDPGKGLQQRGLLTLDIPPDVHDTRSYDDHHRGVHIHDFVGY